MKKIILPTDFSENAENAIEYALKLFKDEECAFYLLNTYMPSAHYEEYPWYTDLEDSDPEKAMAQLAALLESLSKKYKNPKHIFVPHSALNTVVGEIKEIIKKENINLVVMGTQGLTGAKDLFFGTNAIQVIKNVACPVITVPSGFKYKEPKKILFATDYEITYPKEQLKELLDIAGDHQAHIAVLHVSSANGMTENQLANKSRLEKIIEGIDHQSYIVADEEIYNSINHFQLKNNMNFLVMIQNKRTFLERLFLKSEIKQIGLHIKVPFMVIPFLSKK